MSLYSFCIIWSILNIPKWTFSPQQLASSLVFRMFYRDSSSKIHSASPNPVVLWYLKTQPNLQVEKRWTWATWDLRLKRMATMVGTSETGKVLPWLKDFPMAQNDRVFLMVLTIQWNLVPVKMVPENLCDWEPWLERSWVGADEDLSQGLPARPGVSIVMGAPQIAGRFIIENPSMDDYGISLGKPYF